MLNSVSVISLSANHGLIDDIMNASIKNTRCSICMIVSVLCVVQYVLGLVWIKENKGNKARPPEKPVDSK